MRLDGTTGSSWDAAEQAAFLRAISMYRPLGFHRHFHMVSVLHALSQSPNMSSALELDGHLWNKLGEYYDVNELNKQEENGGDENHTPHWMRDYEGLQDMLRTNERARTRLVHGLDKEEFALQPFMSFEPWMEVRRVAPTGDHESQSDVPQSVVPPSSDDDLTDADSESKTDEREMRSSANHPPRRNRRKRAHTEVTNA